MCKIPYFRSENIYKLKYLLKNTLCFFHYHNGGNSVIVNQLQRFWEKVEKHKYTYISIFGNYTIFGSKFTYKVDRCLQIFLSSCLENSDFSGVDFDLVDL